MIKYLVTAKHPYTVSGLLQTWPEVSAPVTNIIAYEVLDGYPKLDARLVVFSDVERLAPQQRDHATSIWERLHLEGSARVLNHPTRTLKRYELLKRLAENGMNRFEAHRLDDGPLRPRYPVFVREADEHTGSLTPLLADEAALERAVAELSAAGYGREGLLAVEFCDTRDAQGIYRKYSAFRIGDRILPRHVLYSRHWVLKDRDVVSPSLRAEMMEYVATNPHAERLREVFDLANCEYGRIDYSVLDGAIQVWEINTNPMVLRPRYRYRRSSRPFHAEFGERFAAALAEEAVSARSLVTAGASGRDIRAAAIREG
jgi:hypothetical protein